jgi:YVTN family beta-propeller protein
VTFHSKIQIAGLLFLGLVTDAVAVCPPDCNYMSVPQVAPIVNIYSEIGSDKLSPVVASALPRIYVPNHSSNTVSVIDPATHKVVDTYRVGQGPQHIVPSWDLKTLWVANTANQTTNGSMTPIDPKTGKPGKNIPVTDPYNMYYTPDGSSAIIVAEAYKKLDFRDPVTMALQYTIATPICRGINHADYSADYSFMVITCEFGKVSLIKVDMKLRKVVSGLVFSKEGMPQDVRLSPDGKTFYVTDMMNDGVFLVDAETLKETGFIETGIGAHGLTTSRDGKRLYVGNRGSNRMPDRAGGKGSVSVIEFATNKIVAQWPIPGGGSPDMGNVTADGKELWLAGRYDGQVYAIDTTTGAVIKINVGIEPHGLTVWPQPGRFSLGHTGNMR